MRSRLTTLLALTFLCSASLAHAQQALFKTQKPPLHGKRWMAVTGKPLAATAGAIVFQKGGNAVDAAAAMIAATATMWDTLGWGGETQALIYNPRTGKVVGINALGVAPTGATPELYKAKGMKYPPDQGPLAATTPGTPGGIITMVAEFGKLSLKDVLEPAIDMADGYAIEAQSANTMERNKEKMKDWPYSKALFFPHPGEKRESPSAGELFKQADLAATLRKLVEAEQQALKKGKSRKEAIYAAYDRFYKGDIAKELVRGTQEQGGLITMDDLAKWQVRIEEPVHTSYKGVDVYKLTTWTQGPVLLQTLNILENFDLKAMGYDSSRYIHTLYQAMNLAYADRDFYYGDPYVGPVEPIAGLLSKEYAKERAKLIKNEKNDAKAMPGDPYLFQGSEKNPFLDVLKTWNAPPPEKGAAGPNPAAAESDEQFEAHFRAGTTSVEAADAEGWAVSVTPSGGWLPVVVAGHTGVGLSERMQSFVLDANESPYNVLEPGKHPRVTLTPSLALKDNKPWLVFSVQGGDSQDQDLLQFFLNVVEFGMTIQEATEAANFTSYQMHSSFGAHDSKPGKIQMSDFTPPWVRGELAKMGYDPTYVPRSAGPINAIMVDQGHGTLWGGSSNNGEDYGIGW
jgi:gamma-glutamyltranspeptidase/glutathione hydrolase